MANNVPLDHWGRGPGGKPQTSAGAHVTQPAKAVQRPTLRHEKPAPQRNLSANVAPTVHSKPVIHGRDIKTPVKAHTRQPGEARHPVHNVVPERTKAPVFQPEPDTDGQRRRAYPGNAARHSRPGDAASKLYPRQGAR